MPSTMIVAGRLITPTGGADCIHTGRLTPKPAKETYDAFLALHGIDAPNAAMFEDLPRNLVAPRALGMATVLIIPTEATEILGEAWEQEGRDAAHVDFVTDDLPGFLEALLAAIGAG